MVIEDLMYVIQFVEKVELQIYAAIDVHGGFGLRVLRTLTRKVFQLLNVKNGMTSSMATVNKDQLLLLWESIVHQSKTDIKI